MPKFTFSESITQPETRHVAIRQKLELGLCLDKSGSMDAVQSNVIGGYNSLVNEQRTMPGHVATTLVEFGTTDELIFDDIPIVSLPILTAENYSPWGYTALLDGLGSIMERIGERFDASEIDSVRVLIAILSDGLENSSSKHTLEQIIEDISFRRVQDGWEFIFLAAGKQAADYARRLGIPEDHIINFLAEDVETLLLKLSQGVRQYRLGDKNYHLLLTQ